MKAHQNTNRFAHLSAGILLLLLLLMTFASCTPPLDYSSDKHAVSFSHSPEWEVEELDTEIRLSRRYKGGFPQNIQFLFDSPEASTADNIVKALENHPTYQMLREHEDLWSLEGPHAVPHPDYELAQACVVLMSPVNFGGSEPETAVESDQSSLELPGGIQISLLTDQNRSITVISSWPGLCEGEYGTPYREGERKIIETLVLE